MLKKLEKRKSFKRIKVKIRAFATLFTFYLCGFNFFLFASYISVGLPDDVAVLCPNDHGRPHCRSR